MADRRIGRKKESKPKDCFTEIGETINISNLAVKKG
jgi:hypothetical protein